MTDGQKTCGKPAQSKSDQTRAAIMEAGAALFATRGFRATGIRDIAEAAGVNVALISYHFGGKGPLYDEILADAVSAAEKFLFGGETVADGFPEERLVRAFANALTARPSLPAMILREQMDPDRMLEPHTVKTLLGFMELTERMLDSLPLDTEAAAWDRQIVHLCVVGPLIHYLVATQVREALSSRVGRALSTPNLDEFVQTHAAMLRRALAPPMRS